MCTASAPQTSSSPTFEQALVNIMNIAQQNSAIESYKNQSAEQQRLMTQQLQQQIDWANAAMAQQQQELAAEQARAAAQGQTQQGSYAVETAKQAPSAAEAKTTAMVREKPNPRATLKIAPGSTANAAGAGLNIGM